jgi:hypothetical protein
LNIILLFLSPQVGNEMVANKIPRCQMIGYMVTLALVTPIGMIIGIILTIHVDGQSGQNSNQNILDCTLQSLKAGLRVPIHPPTKF